MKLRVPFANIGLIKLPDGINDDQAILLADIFPTNAEPLQEATAWARLRNERGSRWR